MNMISTWSVSVVCRKLLMIDYDIKSPVSCSKSRSVWWKKLIITISSRDKICEKKGDILFYNMPDLTFYERLKLFAWNSYSALPVKILITQDINNFPKQRLIFSSSYQI